MKLRALILGSSKGIGKCAFKAAIENNYEAEIISSSEINTSNSSSIQKFINRIDGQYFDLILLNSGGLPPAKVSNDSQKIKLKEPILESLMAHTIGYVELLESININKNCLIMHVSSHVVMNKEGIMFASASARSAMESIINYLPLIYPKHKLTCINLRFGPVLTSRLFKLLEKNAEDPKNMMKDLKATSESPINTDQLSDFFSYLIKSGRYIHGSCTLNLDSGINAGISIIE